MVDWFGDVAEGEDRNSSIKYKVYTRTFFISAATEMYRRLSNARQSANGLLDVLNSYCGADCFVYPPS